MTSTPWITGARGFIGRHLARSLAQEGQRVVGLGHGAWPGADAAAWGVSHWLDGEISASNLSALGRAVGRPQLVYHLAGGSSVAAAIAAPHEDFQRTVAGTAALLEWLRQEAPEARLVAVSSAAVYGAGHEGPISESAELRPYSPYGHHKAMMESLCRSYGSSFGLRSVIVRLFSVYGAGLRKQLLWDLCSKLEAAAAPPVLGGSGDELRDWTDIRDVVRGLVQATRLASADAPAFNLASGTGTRVRTIASLVLAAWHPAGAERSVRFNEVSRAGDPFSLVADARALATHGFDSRILPGEGIADYVRWFQQRTDGTD